MNSDQTDYPFTGRTVFILFVNRTHIDVNSQTTSSSSSTDLVMERTMHACTVHARAYVLGPALSVDLERVYVCTADWLVAPSCGVN